MREPTFIAAVGMTGVGKTYQNLIQIRNVVLGNPEKHVAPQKVLILDNNMEYRNDNADVLQILAPYRIYIKTIRSKDVYQFSRQAQVEVARIVPVDDNGNMLAGKKFGEKLNEVLENMVGGLIVAEDFKAMAGNSLNEELIGQLVTRRHKGCDTLVSLQHLRMISPVVMAVTKWVRLHESSGDVEKSNEKFSNIIELVNIAKNIVHARYMQGGMNERFFVKIQVQRQFISGQYMPQEFQDASCKYIFENWSQTVGKKLYHRNVDTGKKIYNDKTALQEVLKEYTSKYSQYSPRHKKS